MRVSHLRSAAVAFDLDGTLVDLERLHHRALLEAAGQAGLHLTWQQAFKRLRHFVGGPDRAVAEEIAALAPRRVSPVRLLAEKRRRFSSLVEASDEVVPRDGVVPVVRRLLRLGIPVAVGTVTERDLALGILRRSGLLALFEEGMVVAANDVARLKPAPDVYLETARRLGVRPQQQLVFEDSVTGVSAGSAARSRVVAVPTLDDPGYLVSLGDAGAERTLPRWRDPALLPVLRSIGRLAADSADSCPPCGGTALPGPSKHVGPAVVPPGQ